jgi:hypothetical protein
VLDPRLLAGSGALFPDISDDDDDMDPGPPDQHDYTDFGHGGCALGPSRAQDGPLDLLAHVIQELEGLSTMNNPDISFAVDAMMICRCDRKGMYHEFLYKLLWQ